MKFLKYLIAILLITSSSCYAFDFNGLTEDNLEDRVITSLRQEPEKWILRNTGLTYFEDDKLREKASTASFPEVKDGCRIEIAHSIIGYNDGYVIIEKPYKMHFSDDGFNQMAKVIREFIYANLHDEFNIRMPDRKVVVKHEEPVKKEIVEKPIKEEKEEEYSPFGYNKGRY